MIRPRRISVRFFPRALALALASALTMSAAAAAAVAAAFALAPVRLLGAQPAPRTIRTITIDERLAADARLAVGDTLVASATPGGAGDTVVIAAITRRGSDPAEIARSEYRVRMHLDQLQALTSYGDRVDRFAVATRSAGGTDRGIAAINDAAFGFRAYRSSDIGVRTSRTFQVVSRFHRAIGVITIVASSIFLLCIMLLKVEERRRDVAALRLMGISRLSVARSVVIEAVLVALFGSALGVGIGATASWFVNVHYQAAYRTPLTFALVSPDIITFAVGLSLVLGTVAGALASIRLVRAAPLSLFGR